MWVLSPSHLPRCDNSCPYILGTMPEALGGERMAQGSKWPSLDSNPGPSSLHCSCIIMHLECLTRCLAKKKKSRLIIKTQVTGEYLFSYLCSKSVLSTYVSTPGTFLEYSSKQNRRKIAAPVRLPFWRNGQRSKEKHTPA